MEQAINAYYTITAESEFREKERLWAKARHDEAQALSNAQGRGEKREREKWQKVAEENERLRLQMEKIITATGLSREEKDNFSNAHQSWNKSIIPLPPNLNSARLRYMEFLINLCYTAIRGKSINENKSYTSVRSKRSQTE